MHRLVIFSILLLVSTLVSSTVKTPEIVHDNIAKVIFTVGKVFRLAGKKQTVLKKGELLNEGDYIITMSNSIALIKVENSDKTVTSMIKINQKTKMKIRVNRAVPMAHLSIGSVVVKVMSSDKTSKHLKLKVQTRVAAIGVRGTEFFVYANNEKGQVTSLKEGEVEINGAGSSKSLHLAQGYTSTTNTKKQLTQPRKYEWQEDINWKVNPTEGDLAQPKSLFKSVEATWNQYKHEQEYRYKMYKQDQKNRFNNLKESNDKMRNKLFGN